MKSPLRARANLFELQELEIRRFLTTASITSGNTLTITGTGSADTITVNRSSSTNKVSVTGVSTTFTSGSSAGQFNKIVINAQAGSDTIFISGNVGSSIPATINAGDGDDEITTGLEDDVIFGQNGFDTVNYSARTASVTVKLDGLQNDGETQNGETDNVNTEEVIGGAGNDVFTGNDSANFFSGGAGADQIAAAGGNDELVGNTGQDKLFGEGGDDSLYAKNSDIDTVNGGTGPGTTDLDLAEIDGIDIGASIAQARAAALTAASTVGNPAALDTNYGGNQTGLNTGQDGVDDLNWQQVTAATVDSQGRTILVGYDLRDDGSGNFGYDFVALRYNADGTWDNTFSGDGEAVVNFDQNPGGGYGYADDDFAYGVTTDINDNIIIVGATTAYSEFKYDADFAIARLTSDGLPDSVFGTRRYDVIDSQFGGGTYDEARDVVVQTDGSIVVAGTADIYGAQDLAVMRLDSQGNLDGSFNNGLGINTLDTGLNLGTAVALQSVAGGGENIIVAGRSDADLVFARFTSAGDADSTFGSNGALVATIDGNNDQLNDIAINANNEIVAVGEVFFDAPITGAVTALAVPSGGEGLVMIVDANGAGYMYRPGLTGANFSFNAVAIDPATDNIVVVGSDGADFVLARYDSSLVADPSFNGGALVFTDFSPAGNSWADIPLGVAVLTDGKIVAAGYSDTCGDGCIQTSVARYGAGEEGPVQEIEGILTYDDVQNQKNPPRSGLATFYLKSTHLDSEGRATIDLTNNNDVVTITKVIAGDGTEQAAVTVGDLVLYYDMDTTSITINCLNGNDVVTADNSVIIPLIILGGNGTDQLTGGGAADVIVGGQGNDTIGGNNGNDILIGGAASDALNGGAGEDILIGGATAYDNNMVALKALQAEWSSGGSNATRISNIRNGGGLNGSFVLKVGAGATVFDDSAKDTYIGGNDRDWFFRRNSGGAGSRDVVLDNLSGEELNDF